MPYEQVKGWWLSEKSSGPDIEYRIKTNYIGTKEKGFSFGWDGRWYHIPRESSLSRALNNFNYHSVKDSDNWNYGIQGFFIDLDDLILGAAQPGYYYGREEKEETPTVEKADTEVYMAIENYGIF